MKWPYPAPHRAADRARRASATTLAVLLAGATVSPSAAVARDSDLGQAIEVNADRSEYDERAGTQVLSGNVEISQGTMRISADRIEIELDEGRLARIQGSGSPIRFEQQNEAGGTMRGEASSIRYDAVGGSLVLEGNATLAQPGQSLSSQRISFDSKTQKISAEGGGGGNDGGRVSIRIEPPARQGDGG